MKVVVDSCIFVSMFYESDPKRDEARKILEDMIEGKIEAITSVLALPEICGIIKRLTQQEKLARNVESEIKKWIRVGLLSVEELTKERMFTSSDIAIKLSLRGADAVFASLAQELNAKLLTFDEEVKKKVKGKVKLF